jgi:hypothetical protein
LSSRAANPSVEKRTLPKYVWAGRDSNPWPLDYQSSALAKLPPKVSLSYRPGEPVEFAVVIIALSTTGAG